MRWINRTRLGLQVTRRACRQRSLTSLAQHRNLLAWKPLQSYFYRKWLLPRVVFSHLRSLTSSGNTTTEVPLFKRQQHTASPRLKTRLLRKEKADHAIITSRLTVSNLSRQLGISKEEIVKVLNDLGEEVQSTNEVISPEVVELLCMEFDITPKFDESLSSSYVSRPPVVTIMGHVDHGKTTLLDALRNSSIAAGEAGGITQHIGAFLVKLPSGDQITFIDTPGHAAFNSMRARGANVTDIVILVVAADDGVKTQTVESIRHAAHAKVPIIVAINKIDKPKKNVDLLKRQLLSHGIQLEEYGGDVQVVEISALKGTNLDSLTEAIITLAEINDLKSKKDTSVEGFVIESRKDKGLGPVVTALVQHGVLTKGSILVAGTTFAKVRQMYDDRGKVIDKATSSTPVQVTGWKELPAAGERILQVDTEQKANEMASARKTYEEQKKKEDLSRGVSMSEILKEEEGKRTKVSRKEYDATDKLDIVIKGDVDGSVEAVLDALKTYKSDKIKLSVLHAAVGPISESDIKMAHSFKGVVLGFNIKASKEIQQLAKQMDVPIKIHRVIYKLLTDLKDEISSRLPLIKEETTVGEAEIIQVFKLTGAKKACVAGCRVRQGVLNKDCTYRILRGDNSIYEGKLFTLKRGSDYVDIVKKEQECGLSFEKFSGFKEGDRVECFQFSMVQDEIEWDWGF